ncbi:MAG TPA: universal stress protein [Longimicrobiales bacterium]|nr:universal stress protein [Longimicrobiales bacterium]
MIRSIMVPLDGSAFAEHALPYALEIARRAQAALHPTLVYVADEPWRGMEGLTPYRFEGETSAEPSYEEEERGDEQAYLKRVAELASGRGVTAVPALLEGHVPDALERHATHVGADLVVMASHGSGVLDRAWLGSVADAMVRRLPVPILLARPTGDSPPDLARSPAIERILVPLDGSTLAEQALEPARQIGHLWQAQCTLFGVTKPGMSLGDELVDHPTAGSPAASGDALAAARNHLEHIADRIRPHWSGVTVEVVEERHVARAILWAAERLKADMIALATHGRGGLARMVLGSVADKVVRGANIPVLIRQPASPPE